MPVVRSRARRTSTTPSSHGGPQRGFAASHSMVPGSNIHEKVSAAAASKTSRRKCSNVTTASQIREVSGHQKSKKRPTWTFEAANSQWAKNFKKKSNALNSDILARLGLQARSVTFTRYPSLKLKKN